ncbi:MAG TPA: response regulator [Cyclobacteriaceae bacterium]|nr:response regulator [Cyclobacteriaceae bacterium]HMV10945.1 response regulator [Cyclobacteriaceae bacterium]HMV89129.1 response regulator [Cyclobacteriaceae bacterium]HMX00036.1 response regulator [Cyclobacteriaceae bacterium]HMX49102.1 response regulator [Cyclobacteriaceae bacterium]
MKSERYILLVDDDPDEHLLFQDALKELKNAPKLSYARDGQQLMQHLDAAHAELPAIIFLDLNMPRMNGFECLQEIRKSPKLNHIPVVIFSTTSQSQAIDKVYEQGANYYIRKPNTFAMLKEVIERMLEIDWNNNQGQTPKENFVLNKNG